MKTYAPALALGFLVIATACTKGEDHPGPIYEKVLPGSSTLKPSHLTPHKVRYSKPGGTMTFDLNEIDVDGRGAFQLDVWFNKAKGEGKPDRIIFDATTLGLVSRNFDVGNNYEIDVQFMDGRFTGDLIPGEGSTYTPVKYDKAYPHNAFEPAVINYFIAALPLKDGYTASIPVFDLNNGSQILWSNIEVVGRETIEAKGKSFDTWKVVSNGIRKKTIWISEEGHIAIKMKTSGAMGTWVLAEFEKGTPAVLDSRGGEN